MALFHQLKVAKIEKRIKNATSITFELQEQLYEQFSFLPGQHLVIKFMIDGENLRRSYSLNSCPYNDEPLQITVKRIKDGRVSNYVYEHLKVGDELEVMEPQGRFYAELSPKNYKTYFLFAAGSGITPILSILKSVLEVESMSNVHLFYGNKNKSSILFKTELEALQQSYGERLTFDHTLSSPYSDWSSMLGYSGKKGRIDGAEIEWFINKYPPTSQDTRYYICGPGKMNLGVRKALLSLDVPKELIHFEQFGGQAEDVDLSIQGVAAQATVRLNGKTHQVGIKQGETILQALKAKQLEPPYSCENGVCATCVAKLTKGKAEMRSCIGLEEKEVKNGAILTCQALPMTSEIGIDFTK